ncbi:MAG: hypothetical protein LBL26_09460 [Peptococcaceae bacterium]|nr:hypothetical protein [Peptococcaceae bacterium]
MSVVKDGRDEVILGSGHVYLTAYSGSLPPATDDVTIEVAANSVGRIQGGASLEYAPTEYQVVDDDNEIVKRFITKEDVTFKSGVLTWDLENLAKLGAGNYTDNDTTGVRTLTIGGAKALTSYLLRFVHDKDDGHKLRVTMAATAGSGFTLTFAKDKETVVDANFGAISQSNGVMVEIRETYPVDPA